MKYLLPIILLAGCSLPDVVAPDATPLQVEDAMAYSAATLAFFQPGVAPEPPSPPPNPVPTPGETCARCNGTGRIKPDGRIEINCPDCDGDGKTSAEVNEAWTSTSLNAVNEHTELENRLLALESRLDATVKDHECFCGPDCRCVGECKCLWPGQCLGKPDTRTTEVRKFAHLEWLSDGATVKRRCAETGLPALVHFYTDSCQPCQVMDDQVFSDPEVVEYIQANFIPWRCNAEWVGDARRSSWTVDAVPAERVVRSDWSSYARMDSSTNPQQYLANLKSSLTWSQRPRAVSQPLSQTISQQYVQPAYYYQQPRYYQPQYSMPYYFGGGGGCVGGNCY